MDDGDLRGVQGHRQHGAGPRPPSRRPAHLPGDQHRKSGTRKDDLLLDPKDLAKIWVLRKYLSDYNPTEAMEFLIDKLSKTKDNQQFLGAMNA
jgi:transcription termination factor Rho